MDGLSEDKVLKYLEEQLGKRLRPTMLFADFALDSLDAVELSINLEREYGVRVREVHFLDPYRNYTVQNLLDQIRRVGAD